MRASRHSVAATRGRPAAAPAREPGLEARHQPAMASPVGPTSAASVSSGSGVSSRSERRGDRRVGHARSGRHGDAVDVPRTAPPGRRCGARVSARSRVSPRPAVPERMSALGCRRRRPGARGRFAPADAHGRRTVAPELAVRRASVEAAARAASVVLCVVIMCRGPRAAPHSAAPFLPSADKGNRSRRPSGQPFRSGGSPSRATAGRPCAGSGDAKLVAVSPDTLPTPSTSSRARSGSTSPSPFGERPIRPSSATRPQAARRQQAAAAHGPPHRVLHDDRASWCSIRSPASAARCSARPSPAARGAPRAGDRAPLGRGLRIARPDLAAERDGLGPIWPTSARPIRAASAASTRPAWRCASATRWLLLPQIESGQRRLRRHGSAVQHPAADHHVRREAGRGARQPPHGLRHGHRARRRSGQQRRLRHLPRRMEASSPNCCRVLRPSDTRP
jgi:hypothetical protein